MDNLDLTQPETAYLFAFALGDGHLWKGKGNKGKLTIELARKDRALLEHFQSLLPVATTLRDRCRDTNFKDNYKSTTLTICDMAFRKALHESGMPVGKKSNAPILTQRFSATDFWRGLIDANGSVGYTASGIPFVSLNTASSIIASSYAAFLKLVISKEKKVEPNNRDHTYNIVVWKEDAQKLCRILYYQHCIALARKLKNAQRVLKWKRPKDMRIAPTRRAWTTTEDQYVQDHTVAESVAALNRTAKSISVRIWRLRG